MGNNEWLVKPGIVAALLITFIFVWKEFMFAVTLFGNYPPDFFVNPRIPKEVDVLLLPRIVEMDGFLMCPNFRAIPDMVGS